MRINDSNYIMRLKLGKEDTLEFIVDKYLPLVKGVTYKILSANVDEGKAEECINDIFLSVWENRQKFYGEDEEFKKWICAIAKYKAIDYYRKINRSAEIVSDNIDIVKSQSVEDEVVSIEDREELLKLINTLEPMDRDIVIMKFFFGEKNENIAEKFGVTKATIDNRIYRAKKKLIKKRKTLRLEVI